MNTSEIYRNMYFNKLSQRFAEELQRGEIENKILNEVFNACALGCSLQKPRKFGKDAFGGQDFREIADNAPFEIFAVAADALLCGKDIKNRLWYVLGVLVQNRQNRPRRAQVNVRGYTERVYTSEELRGCITKIEDLAGLEI